MKTCITALFPLLFLWCGFSANGQSQHKNYIQQEATFRLGGQLPQIGDNDTLVLTLWPHLFYNGVLYSPQTTQKLAATKGDFQFSFPAPEGPFYFSLYLLKRDNGEISQIDLLPYYIGKKGDDIKVNEQGKQLVFYGAGATKVRVQYAAKNVETVFRHEGSKKIKQAAYETDEMLLKRLMAHSARLLTEKLQILNKKKHLLSKEILNLIQADFIAENLEERIFTMQNGLFGDPIKLEKYRLYCKKYLHPLFNETISTIAKSRSRLYVPILLEHELLERRLHGQVSKGSAFYQSLTNQVDKKILDRLRTELVLRYYPKFSQGEIYMKSALQDVTTPYCRAVLLQLFSRSQKGKPIYHYPLKDTASNTIYLSDLKGKYVFIDVWYIGCGGCRSFYQGSLKQVEEHFKAKPDIVFVSICADENRGRWLNAVQSGHYTSSSMVNLTAGGFESPFLTYYNVHTYPFQILLDKEGKICRMDDLQKKPNELIDIINSYLQP
jgi:hypothetical protein